MIGCSCFTVVFNRKCCSRIIRSPGFGAVSFKTATDEELAGSIAGVRDEDLYNMILDLPDNERTVLNLFVFEGMSHREIARELGIGESASAMRLYRAKAHLAEMIKNYERE